MNYFNKSVSIRVNSLSPLPLYFFAFLVMSGALLITSYSPPLNAQELTIDSAINKAGRQRMLTQRILKSYLLIGQNVDVDSAQRQLDQSIALFEQQLDELGEFTTDKGVTKSLDRVQRQWQQFRQRVLEEPNTKNAISIINEGDELLVSCEKVVKNLELMANSNKGKIINLSGRQRMLSQRIGMLYAAHSWGVDNREISKNLEIAIKEYDEALVRLQAAPINTKKISDALAKVASKWEFSRSGFSQMDNERYVPFIIQMTTESMLKKMNDITGMYEALGES
ncbi:type IV pili methyl-accepting chemotaxis transducer N-terminal domain-containing protein [Alkalimarinus sediminis]|uniref:Type IV pili methyl-accepting chemotaxis transducer N-terminal domain-containing protein n=1 Tax=Alkalimarinus sediminis TaxID=1632866 RepID=A0A9E8HGW3_9ALTE|nr:type IV pili methyl-accepting chemotaxis transducer N-terminal domain-containing protein [Alkalimarinus sediminis]UZW74443.1 type IV pili methyl-accepting chemotaxis transducer N-terminal domain-containing protein [Alkalimarinus sediminis]